MQMQSKIPPPWIDFIPPLLEQQKALPYVVRAAKYYAIGRNIYNIQIALHWVIKLEWDSRYKIPEKRVVIEATKPIGVWLQSILHLCEKAHSASVLGGQATRYLNAANWFSAIVQEIWAFGIASFFAEILYPVADTEIEQRQRAISRDKKRLEIRLLHNTCSRIKALEKPVRYPLAQFAQFQDLDTTDLALGDLLAKAIDLAERSDQFRKQTFTPCVRAMRTMIDAFDSPKYISLEVDGNRVYEQGGSRYKKLKYET
jgi:hypothetical protein